MNKRIKELAEQAGFDVKRLMVMHPGGFPRDDFLALESFAELIVRECVEVVDAARPGVEQFPAEVALDIVTKNMKAYLGVEE